MASLTWLLDIFFAPRCYGCGLEGEWLCDACLLGFDWSLSCHENGVWYAALLTTSFVKESVHLLKYGGITDPIRKIIASLTPSESWQGSCFIPVPISHQRRKERGYNQAEIIAECLAKLCKGSVAAEVLGKHERASLVGKSREERIAQAQNQFYWRGGIKQGGQYVVVDDVMTTGSTLGACLAILKEKEIVAEGFAVAYEPLL